MKISRKILIESIVNVLKFGVDVYLINHGENNIRLNSMMNNKKIMAKCLFKGIWSNYMYDLSIEGVTKCLKFVTIEEITGKKALRFNPIGEESVIKFRSFLSKEKNRNTCYTITTKKKNKHV